MNGLIVIGGLFMLYRWFRYRRSSCYREYLQTLERIRQCQERLQLWSRAMEQVEQYLAQAPRLEAQGRAACQERILAPRRAAVLAVENLRQFKGIGRDTVGLLQANGYVTADRIDRGILRLPGIGPVKADRILAAARHLQAAAAALEPNEEERTAIATAEKELRERYADWVRQLTTLREEVSRQVAQLKGDLQTLNQLMKEVRRFSFLRYVLSPRRTETALAAFLQQHPAPKVESAPLPPVIPPPPEVTPPSLSASTRVQLPDAAGTKHYASTGLGPAQRFVEVAPAADKALPSSLTKPSRDVQVAPVTSIRVVWKRSSQFIKDSLRYREPVTKPVPYVPFRQYWPTFQSMSQEQIAYYRWWRTEWLSGRKVPVDLSYIFVFVYELINCSYEEDPYKAYQLLCRLFESYREEEPTLWNYAEWVGDMAWELRLEEDAIAWYGRDETTYDIALSLAQDRGIRVLPVEVLMRAFGIRPSVHFSRHADELTTLLESAFVEADEWCRTTQQRSFLDALAGSGATKVTRDLYRSAVIERRLMRSGPRYTVYRGTTSVVAGIQALARLVDNIHREAKGVGRKLQVDLTALPEPLVHHLLSFLRRRLGESRAHPVVQFDASVLAALHKESAVVESLLGSVLSEESGEEGNQRHSVHEESPDITPEQPVDAPTVPYADAQPPTPELPQAQARTLSDLFGSTVEGGFEEFFAALSEDQVQFLKLFRDGKPVDKAVAMRFVRDRGALFVTFVDQINELALEYLGDNLLEDTEDEVRLAEPFVADFTAYWGMKEAH